MKTNQSIDLSQYKNTLSFYNQLLRFIWSVVWFIFARPLPRSIGNKWRILLLKLFGAKISWKCGVYPTARIYMPWRLKMDDYATIANEVDCYNVDWIILGKNVVVSQKTFLCTASHDIYEATFSLKTAPIILEENTWIAADAYVGPGVTVKQGAVVAARAVVVKDVEAWNIVGGNPAKVIGMREIKS